MGYLLTSISKITCPHGGAVRHSSKNLFVPYINGSPVCLMHDTYDIFSCPLWGDLRCARVEWWSGCIKTIDGSPVLTHISKGVCYNTNSLILGFPLILLYQKEIFIDEGE